MTDPTTLTCKTTGHAAGVLNVVITNPDGQTSTLTSGYIYTAAPAPTASGISPGTGPTAGGTSVTITGTGFASGAQVYFGGSATCGAVSVTSSTSLTCVTPAHASGLVNVAVVNSDNQSVTMNNVFNFQPPSVTVITPTGGNTTGGTFVTINGTNFTAGSTNATVTIGGAGCTGVTVVSPTQITCTTTAHVAQTVAVTVTDPDNSSGTLNAAFTYRPPPAVSGIVPANGPIAGGTSVTINGSGFVTGPSPTVTIGGVACGALAYVSANQLTCTTGASVAAGTSAVLVTNNDGQQSNASVSFLYYAPLAIKPGAFTIAVGQSFSFAATNSQGAAVVSGGVPPYSYSLSATPVGTLSAAGNYTAPATPGGPDTVTVTDSATPAPNTASATIKTVKAASIFAGYQAACAVMSDGSLKCWGGNNSGQLGQNDKVLRGSATNSMGGFLSPVAVGASVLSGGIGQTHACVRVTGNSVKCWGGNAYGQLGQGSSGTIGDGVGATVAAAAFINLGTGRSATQIAVGANHVCALLDNSTVKCWGYNGYGQLGYGDTLNRGLGATDMGDSLPAIAFPAGFTPSAVAAGDNHSCAMSTTGAVLCWGLNSSGQLGQNNTTNIGNSGTSTVAGATAINFGGGTATGIVAGGNMSCAQFNTTTVRCWGSNGSGQLGLGNTTAEGTTVGQMNTLPAIAFAGGFTISSILAAPSAGGATPQNEFACAMLNNGSANSAICWGHGASGQLGQLSTANAGDGVGTAVSALAAIGLGTGRTPQQIAVGGSFSCALLDDFTIKCWGDNSSGQLGQENTTNRGDSSVTSPDHRMGDNLPPIKL